MSASVRGVSIEWGLREVFFFCGRLVSYFLCRFRGPILETLTGGLSKSSESWSTCMISCEKVDDQILISRNLSVL